MTRAPRLDPLVPRDLSHLPACRADAVCGSLGSFFSPGTAGTLRTHRSLHAPGDLLFGLLHFTVDPRTRTVPALVVHAETVLGAETATAAPLMAADATTSPPTAMAVLIFGCRTVPPMLP